MLTLPILIAVYILVARTFVLLYGRSGRALDPRTAGPADLLDVLFYVLVTLLIVTHHADLILTVLAYVYAIVRVLETGLDMRGRSAAQSRSMAQVGAVALVAMWVVFAIEIIVGY